jgi:hypothetical protein
MIKPSEVGAVFGAEPSPAPNTETAMTRVERVYVNSLQDWRTLKERGLPDAARVRTASPWVAFSEEINAEAVDGFLDHESVIDLFTAFNEVSLDLFEMFGGRDKGAALTAGHTLWDAQRVAYHAALLLPEDFTGSVCITSLKDVSAKLRGVLQFNWDLLLAENPNVVVQNVTVDEEALSFVAPPLAKFWTRFTAARPADIVFRMMLMLGQNTKRSMGLKTVYVRAESELLKDSSIALLRKGYLLRLLETPPPTVEENGLSDEALELVATIENWVESTLPERLASRLSDQALRPVARTIAAQVGREVAAYFDWCGRWTAAFASLRPAPAALVSNGFLGATNVALGLTASKLGVPLITFQHGATREITDKHDNNPLFYESMLADLHFCFNDSHATITGESPLTGGRSVIVGAPAFYRAPRAAKKKVHKILYVSSGLYMGAQDKLHRSATDHAICAFEKRLVEQCFVPSREDILYKPYPALRYLDPDPAVEAARRADNIEVMENPMDLRYIVGQCGMLITSRSGSTIGYCLCQDLPMVYLQVPGRSLRDDVEIAMRASLFFFDAQSSDFNASLSDFLQLSMQRILELWEQKRAARSRFIEQYIANGVGVGGSRVAHAIDKLILENGESHDT